MTIIAPDLSGKVALVTGSSRGIGQVIAQRLAASGAIVALNATKDVSATAAAIAAAGGRSSSHLADIRDAAQVEQLVTAVTQQHGSLDILVNNAGVNRDTLTLRMSESDWRDVIDTNLTGAFFCTKAAIRHMSRKRWGRLIFIGSIVGTRGNAGQANYSAAKSGLEGLTRSLALEMASRNITANVVAPGFIDTEMTAKLDPVWAAKVRDHIPLKRFGTPQEVAELVAFLCGEPAGYITGQTLNIDGGLTLA